MAQAADDDLLTATTAPAELREQMKQTRQSLTEKLDALKQRVLGWPSSLIEKGRNDMPAKKASGKSKATSAKSTRKVGAKKSTSATTKGRKTAVSSKSKKTAAKKSSKKAVGGKKVKRTSSVTKKVTTVMGEVLTAAALGAVKGAVQAAIPPVEKAVGVEEQGSTEGKPDTNQASEESTRQK